MHYSTEGALGFNLVQKTPEPQQSMFSNPNAHSSLSFQIQCNAESLQFLHALSLEEELWSAHS